MPDNIRVRLVPKSREGDSITVNLSELTPQMAKRFAPDPGRTSDALRSALNLGMDVKVTQRNSLDANVPTETCQQLFGVSLVEKAMPSSERATSSRQGTMLSTYQELQVPSDLTDTIAFAYIPTPPIFLAELPIPPSVNVHHLRLMEVLGVLNGARCHRRGWTGRNIRVAMTDTGFANHPYFVSNGYNIERVSTATTEHPLVDTSGHGTGESANVLVMAPDCHFIGVKHNDYSAAALETALAQNPRIITNSWGWDIDNQIADRLEKR